MGSDDGASLVVPTVVLTVIAFIAVLLRFWARKLNGLRAGLDDYLAVAAMAMQVVITADAICAVEYGGLGKDVEVVMVEVEGGLELLLKVSHV